MASGAPRAAGHGRGQLIWAPVLVLVSALASTWAGASGTALVLLAMVIVVVGTYLTIRNPYVGILIFLTTFLFTYPAPLRGVGNLTINNVLGMLLLPMLMYGTLRDGAGWFTKTRPLVMLAIVVAILTTSGQYYNRDISVEGQETVQLRRGSEREIYGARVQTQGALIATRDKRVKFATRYAFLLFFVFFVRTPRQLKGVVALLLFVLFMSYASSGTQAGELGWGEGRLRVTGAGGTGLYTGTNPNKFAFYALFCGAMLWYMRERLRSWSAYIPWMAGLLLAVGTVPLTASRSGFLNLLVFFLVVLLEGRFNYRKIIGLALVAMLAVVQFGYDADVLELLLPAPLAERLTQVGGPAAVIEESEVAQGSFQRRARTMLRAGSLVQVHPLLGVGLGNYPQLLSVVVPSSVPGPPHNSYVWAATEGGLLCLGLYMASFVWVFLRLSDLLRDYDARYGPVDLRWLVNAMRTTLILFMVFSFFADVWAHVFFYVIMGLTLALLRVHAVYQETGQVPGTHIGASLADDGVRI